MNPTLKHLVLSATIALSCAAALATADVPPAANAPHPPTGRGRAADCREHRLNELKARLQLDPEQEAAWNTYLGALRPDPPAEHRSTDDQRELTTPQRIDYMRQWRQQREAEFHRRSTATLAFYGTLNARQQVIFDEYATQAWQHRHEARRR